MITDEFLNDMPEVAVIAMGDSSGTKIIPVSLAFAQKMREDRLVSRLNVDSRSCHG